MGTRGVDFSLVKRLEQERSRNNGHGDAPTEGRPMRYTGSRSDVGLSSGWTAGGPPPADAWGSGSLGDTGDRLQALHVSSVAGGESAVKTVSPGLRPIGQSGNLMIEEAELLGYGSNGTMVFKGRWGDYDVAVKRMHIAFVEMVDAEMKVLLELGADWHPNLLRYHGKDQGPPNPNIVGPLRYSDVDTRRMLQA